MMECKIIIIIIIIIIVIMIIIFFLNFIILFLRIKSIHTMYRTKHSHSLSKGMRGWTGEVKY